LQLEAEHFNAARGAVRCGARVAEIAVFWPLAAVRNPPQAVSEVDAARQTGGLALEPEQSRRSRRDLDPAV